MAHYGVMKFAANNCLVYTNVKTFAVQSAFARFQTNVFAVNKSKSEVVRYHLVAIVFVDLFIIAGMVFVF